MLTGDEIGYLRDMDIKCYEWVWDDTTWVKESDRSIIRMWITENLPRGFTVYRFMNFSIHIQKLGVHPSWRRRGIASELLGDIESAAKRTGVKRIYTILHEENNLGREWLSKRGFIADKVHKEMYPDSRDGYSFSREVK